MTTPTDGPQVPKWLPKVGLVGLIAGINLALMEALGLNTIIKVVVVLVATAAAGVIALPDQGAMLQGRPRKFWLLLAMSVVVPVVLGFAVQAVAAKSPEEQAVDAVSSCGDEGYRCEVVEHRAFSSGTAMLNAYAINRYADDSIGPEGSIVLFMSEAGKPAWQSQFVAGYGIVDLGTDALNHVFARFAVTNHSTLEWVLAATPTGVVDFGTIDGNMKVEFSDDENFTGVRTLYAYREGWPANAQNPTTSRDVFSWNGSQYEFVGCDLVRHLSPEIAVGPDGKLTDLPLSAYQEIITRYEVGSPRCSGPVEVYSFSAPSERAAGQDPP